MKISLLVGTKKKHDLPKNPLDFLQDNISMNPVFMELLNVLQNINLKGAIHWTS